MTSQQTIVITGSTRGIGKGMAGELLKRGHNVVVSGRTAAAVQQAVADLEPLASGTARVHGVPCDVALPCATQNELLGEDAKMLVANGCKAVSEGANMPTDLDGVHTFKHAKILYAPGKASNAGGVAVSGLEMSQNSERRSWKEEELQQMLKDIMAGIHKSCLAYGDQGGGYIDYVKGANIAGFKKVADAMLAFGVV